jgi:hypothetical protein
MCGRSSQGLFVNTKGWRTYVFYNIYSKEVLKRLEDLRTIYIFVNTKSLSLIIIAHHFCNNLSIYTPKRSLFCL